MNEKIDKKNSFEGSPLFVQAIKEKDSFTVVETRQFVDSLNTYCDVYKESHSYGQYSSLTHDVGEYLLLLNKDFDVKTIDSQYLWDCYEEQKEKNAGDRATFRAILFVVLNLNNTYQWNQRLCKMSKIILPVFDESKNICVFASQMLSSNKDIECFRFWRRTVIKKGNVLPSLSFVEFDTSDAFVQNLLIEFFDQYEKLTNSQTLLFIEKFAESLNYNLPKDVYGFNANTLKQQEAFYLKLNRKTELLNRMFYRFILEKKQGEYKSITLQDGISIDYLMMGNFAERFLDGYKLVLFNPNEGYPNFDKWVFSPNGLEEQTALVKPHSTKYLDFSRISDSTIKDAAKQWMWNETKTGFNARCQAVTYLFEFFEYRDTLRKMHLDKFIQARSSENLDIKNTVLSEEIVMYTSMWRTKSTDESYVKRMHPLKLFLEYMNNHDLYKTELVAFEYLTLRNQGQNAKKEILPIPKDEFDKLVVLLEAKAKESQLYMLYYIIFCLNVLTPLRISSILDLDYDCIVEKSKGIYAVNVKTKTSNGDKKDIQISQTVKRLIEVAVSLTSENRHLATNQFKHFLFLSDPKKNIVKTLRHSSYCAYLRTCCSELGLPMYSASNLRKTYYTNLIENAIKNNVSLLSLKELTGHANIDTTENHYVKENIRNYLEATMGVEIGGIQIQGEVVDEYLDAKHEDLVNDECGYCRNKECNVLGTSNCLMCKGFVTTPAHISQFQEAIHVIDNQIRENDNQHDKEHLYVLKRLYAAYIEQIYLKKEGVKND